MNMTRYKLTGLLAALLLLAGCSQEEETLPNQRNSIVSFLTSTHAPQLISEEAVAESPDENPPSIRPRAIRSTATSRTTTIRGARRVPR